MDLKHTGCDDGKCMKLVHDRVQWMVGIGSDEPFWFCCKNWPISVWLLPAPLHNCLHSHWRPSKSETYSLDDIGLYVRCNFSKSSLCAMDTRVSLHTTWPLATCAT